MHTAQTVNAVLYMSGTEKERASSSENINLSFQSLLLLQAVFFVTCMFWFPFA